VLLASVFVLVSAGLALALAIADFTLLVLAIEGGAPTWAVVLIGIVLVGGPLMVGVVPAVRQLEGVAAQALLLVEFEDGPPDAARGWPQRRRTLAWLLLHLLTGAAVVAAVVGLIALGATWLTIPAAIATLLGALLAGRMLARVAPVLLGPSYAERLQRLETDAARATERTRLAREIHDSIGHALSLVTVQAAAARKVIGRNPAFVEAALDTIETTSRRAVADLDHVLGLLRDGTPSRATSPDLSALDGLLSAARTGGLLVDATSSGDFTRLPLLVSREAYRIVQEGLTNALKYSAGRTATLRQRLDADTRHTQLTNPISGRRRGAGRGLRGIEERAAIFGGNALAKADDGHWTLSVTLPVREPSR
jgi:signal transduction histidine kinase